MAIKDSIVVLRDLREKKARHTGIHTDNYTHEWYARTLDSKQRRFGRSSESHTLHFNLECASSLSLYNSQTDQLKPLRNK